LDHILKAGRPAIKRPVIPLKLTDLVLPSVAALKPYEPGKPIEEVQRELGIEHPIKLASNENPLGPSPKAVAAIRAALDDLNRYPDGGSVMLTRKIAARHKLTPAHIFMGCGSVEILNLLAYLFIRPGLNAVTSEHAFAIYELVDAASGGVTKTTPMKDYTFDLDAMADEIDDRTRIIWLANPNNPTATIYKREAWERLLARVPDHVVIVADEAYFEFVRDPDYPNALEYLAAQPRLIVLRTFSKIFGLAGLRVGYGVAHPEMVNLLNNVRQPFNINLLAQAAVMAAMDDAEYVRRTLEVNAAGIEYLEREFRRLGVPYVPTQGNFFMADVDDGVKVYNALLRKGVIVRPMHGYGFPRHVRISVGLAEENRKLIEALAAVLGGAGVITK
jgi:histidinol-phosphate aminotransferase